MPTLSTTCEIEIWSGFFGVDCDGTHPECGQDIEVHVDDYEEDEDGSCRPHFSVECPKCKNILEWPQEWECTDASTKNTAR